MAEKRPPPFAAKTNIPADQTRRQIEDLLKKHGATTLVSGVTATCGFVACQLAGRGLRFTVARPSEDDPRVLKTPAGQPRGGSERNAAIEQQERQRWRALLLVIRAHLEAVQAGVETLEEAFMGETVMPGGRTVRETIAPRLQEAFRTGQMPELLPGLPGGSMWKALGEGERQRDEG